MPRVRELSLSASTTTCRWFDCTVYSITRKSSRAEPRLSARSTTACSSSARRLRSPAARRSVTSTGWYLDSLGRFSCDTSARSPFGLRPAPLAAPVHERELSLRALPLHDRRGARSPADVRALHLFFAQL